MSAAAERPSWINVHVLASSTALPHVTSERQWAPCERPLTLTTNGLAAIDRYLSRARLPTRASIQLLTGCHVPEHEYSRSSRRGGFVKPDGESRRSLLTPEVAARS
jgi:hypothetical protein